MQALRVNGNKRILRNAFILVIFTLLAEKGSKYDKESLGIPIENWLAC